MGGWGGWGCGWGGGGCVGFFFNDTATTEIYTLSLHDALPILLDASGKRVAVNEAVAKTVEPVAFMFYRPLPEGQIGRAHV